MNDKSKNTAADETPLPITANALTRQASRTKKALEDLLANPPSKVKLSTSQEFLAKVWGRTNFSHLKSSIPLQLEQGAASERKISQSLFDRIGVPRSESLIRTFIDNTTRSHPEYKFLARTLVKLIFRIDEQTTQSLASAVFQGGAAAIPAESLETLKRTRPILFSPQPRTAKTLSRWLDLGALEMMAYRSELEYTQSDGSLRVVSLLDQRCRDEIRDFFIDLPGYDGSRFGKRDGQGEFTLDFFRSAVRIVRPVLDLIHDIEVLNPIFWDSRWNGYVDRTFGSHTHSIYNVWPLFAESWLAGDLYLDYFIDRANNSGGQFCATHALELISYGAQSTKSQHLLGWMNKIEVAGVISESLSQFMDLNIKRTGLSCGFTDRGHEFGREILHIVGNASGDDLVQLLCAFSKDRKGHTEITDAEANSLFHGVFAQLHRQGEDKLIAFELAKCFTTRTGHPIYGIDGNAIFAG